MALGTALTVASVATTAIGSAFSFRQANKQKKLYEKYQEDAAKSMVEAKKIRRLYRNMKKVHIIDKNIRFMMIIMLLMRRRLIILTKNI